ncbi:MAG: hypothetical protein WCK63_03625 [Betaproteobacteria bacterium]
MVDQQMRPLLDMRQALTLPLGVYATEADVTDYRISTRAVTTHCPGDRTGLAVFAQE